MKAAAVFPSERRFEIVDHADPGSPERGQAKLQVLEVGVCGTDKEIAAFEYGWPPEKSDYLILGHEALARVVDIGPGVDGIAPGSLVVPTVRRPCGIATCAPCNGGRQDFCSTFQFTERGINRRHGFMCEYVIEDARYLNPVPEELLDAAVLVEPLTIAEKGVAQLWTIQRRLPWTHQTRADGHPSGAGLNALVLGAGPVGLLGAMKFVLEGFTTYVYSRTPPGVNVDQIVQGFGARYIHAENAAVEDLPGIIGSIDVVYEAVGVSSLAYSVMRHLGSNGAFIFAGVPALHGPAPIDGDAIMRDHVLKNRVTFGTVNCNIDGFREAISDIGEFRRRWPQALASIVSRRVPIDAVQEPLQGHPTGIKTIVQVG